MKRISDAKRNEIIAEYQKGTSCRTIAKRFTIGKSTISDICSGVELDVAPNLGGRPRKLTLKTRQRLRRDILSNKARHAKDLHKLIDVDVCTQTLRNALKEQQLYAHTKTKKPLLTHKHRSARLKFALKYRNWTEADWDRVIFSDETKINRMGSDGREWAWGIKGAPLREAEIQRTVKHGGGNLMIWGCMTTRGVGRMCEVEGIMDAPQYAKILDNNLLQSARASGMRSRDFIFQQDNDPKHGSRHQGNKNLLHSAM